MYFRIIYYLIIPLRHKTTISNYSLDMGCRMNYYISIDGEILMWHSYMKCCKHQLRAASKTRCYANPGENDFSDIPSSSKPQNPVKVSTPFSYFSYTPFFGNPYATNIATPFSSLYNKELHNFYRWQIQYIISQYRAQPTQKSWQVNYISNITSIYFNWKWIFNNNYYNWILVYTLT